MNRAFLKGFLCELEKQARNGEEAQQPQMLMMPAIPPEVLAAMMAEPVEYEEPSMLQMLAPSVGLGAAGLGLGASMGIGAPLLAKRYGAPLSNLKTNLAAKAAPMLSRMNPLRFFRKGASEKVAMAFLKQDRPKGVKRIYKALKRDHPEMPAAMKARIAARQGKPGKQHQGPPYAAPLTKGAARRREEEEDPAGSVGLILKLLRRAGRRSDPRMVMAFDNLARNIPSNKRPY